MQSDFNVIHIRAYQVNQKTQLHSSMSLLLLLHISYDEHTHSFILKDKSAARHFTTHHTFFHQVTNMSIKLSWCYFTHETPKSKMFIKFKTCTRCHEHRHTHRHTHKEAARKKIGKKYQAINNQRIK